MDIEGARDTRGQQRLIRHPIAIIIDEVAGFDRWLARNRNQALGRTLRTSEGSTLGRAVDDFAERTLHARAIVRHAIAVIVPLIAELRRGRAHVAVVILAIGSIRDVPLRLKARLGFRVAIAKAVLVEVSIPGDDLGVIVDDAIAIVVDVVTLFGRVGMSGRDRVVAVAAPLHEPGLRATCRDFERITKAVFVHIPVEHHGLGAAGLFDLQALVFHP
jgi:hypothetical protein